MYQKIRQQVPVMKKYAEKLINEKIVTEEEYEVKILNLEVYINTMK